MAGLVSPNHRFSRTFNSFEDLARNNNKALDDLTLRKSITDESIKDRAKTLEAKGDPRRANYINSFVSITDKSPILYSRFASVLKNVNGNLNDNEIRKKYGELSNDSISWVNSFLDDYNHNELGNLSLNAIIKLALNSLYKGLTPEFRFSSEIARVNSSATPNDIRTLNSFFPNKDDRDLIAQYLQAFEDGQLDRNDVSTMRTTFDEILNGTNDYVNNYYTNFVQTRAQAHPPLPPLPPSDFTNEVVRLKPKISPDYLQAMERRYTPDEKDEIVLATQHLPNDAYDKKSVKSLLEDFDQVVEDATGKAVVNPFKIGKGIKKKKKTIKGGTLIKGLPPMINLLSPSLRRDVISGERGSGNNYRC